MSRDYLRTAGRGRVTNAVVVALTATVTSWLARAGFTSEIGGRLGDQARAVPAHDAHPVFDRVGTIAAGRHRVPMPGTRPRS